MIAIDEAKCLGIPTFGIVDTNTNPYVLDFPIPANDDSIKSISIILSFITENIAELLGTCKEVLEEDSSQQENIAEEIPQTKE